ncbi:MAG: biotin-dependent carboxyltransferase family protein, partial [Terracoccus sp.]
TTSAGLEITLGGLEVTIVAAQTLALTGAVAAASLDGQPVPFAAPFTARDGQRLVLGLPPHGLRTYLSVRGGIDVDPVLGSRSTDVLSGVGPKPLTNGSRVPVGDPGCIAFPHVDVAPVSAPAEVLSLAVDLGPRHEWFDDPLSLARRLWTVSSRSNRVGIRLEGEPLTRSLAYAGRELPSEGVVLGAVQVPSSGLPMVFLADHPVTGGYPVIAVVRDDHLDRAAQARPGQSVRFHIHKSRNGR